MDATKGIARVTSAPDRPPPPLVCPHCDQRLEYRQTVIGGVKPVERWDYFYCRNCGPFVASARWLFHLRGRPVVCPRR